MKLRDKIKNLVHYNLIAKLKDILFDIEDNLENTTEEAPIDGNQYGRLNGEWSEIIVEAEPQDLQSVLDVGNEAIDKIINLTTTFEGTTKINLSSPFASTAINTGSINVNNNGTRAMIINNNGQVIVQNGGNVPTYQFDISRPSGVYTVATLDDIKIGTTAPTSATGTGTTGEIRVAAGFIYWCTAPNTWIRAAGVTW